MFQAAVVIHELYISLSYLEKILSVFESKLRVLLFLKVF